MRTLSRLTATVAIQAVVVLLLLEGAGRLLDPLGISYFPETARFYDDLVLEEPIGYRLPPGMNARYWGSTVRTNALGMRDREIGPRTQGEYRIMLLGDSVIFSLGVDYEDSIPWRLEQALSEKAAPGQHYRVLNMGVPSYNTEQELIQLQTLGLGLEPDAVVLMFVANDIEKKMWVYEKRSNPLANFAQRSYAASLLFVAARYARKLLPPAPVSGAAQPAPGAEDPRWHRVESSLLGIAALLRERGIPFLVVSRGEAGAPHLRILHRLSRQHGFAFEEIDAEADPNRTSGDPTRLLLSATNSHCNATGCEAIARSLAHLLAAHGMLSRADAAPVATPQGTGAQRAGSPSG